MTKRPANNRSVVPSACRLALILVALGANGCKDGEWVADPTPDYYYCLKLSTTRINLLPGEVAIINLVDGPCEEWDTWKKSERRPISEAMPFNVQVKFAGEGITVTPTGLTSSNQITVRADASLAAKPWLLAGYLTGGHWANVVVTLQNPRRASRGYTQEVFIHVDDPNKTTDPVKKPSIRLRVSRNILSFGNVKVATEVSQAVRVYNGGTETAAIAAVAPVNCSPGPCPFQVAGLSAGDNIKAGSYRNLTVIFKPTVSGYASVDLLVHPTQGTGASLRISGTGQ